MQRLTRFISNECASAICLGEHGKNYGGHAACPEPAGAEEEKFLASKRCERTFLVRVGLGTPKRNIRRMGFERSGIAGAPSCAATFDFHARHVAHAALPVAHLAESFVEALSRSYPHDCRRSLQDALRSRM